MAEVVEVLEVNPEPVPDPGMDQRPGNQEPVRVGVAGVGQEDGRQCGV